MRYATVRLFLCLLGLVKAQHLQFFENCGMTVAPLISHGRPIRQGEFPWLAALYLRDPSSGQWDQSCGGTLISPSLVMTAAHCLVGIGRQPIAANAIKVGLGKLYRDFSKNEQFSTIADVSEVVIPPNYLGSVANYALDVGLLRLATPVQFTSYIAPACVDWYAVTTISNGTNVYVAGWGTSENSKSTETAFAADMHFQDYPTCVVRVIPEYRKYVTHEKFCALSGGNGSQVDRGDSGGGLTWVKNGRHFVIGIVSMKVMGQTAFSIFTKVWNSEIHSWLKVEASRLDPGDVCKGNGKKWTCIPMTDCPKYQEDLKKNITPATCAYVNNQPFICCDTPRKSRQMCEKYAESVYSEGIDLFSGEPVKVDSCAVVEPSISGRRFAQPREYPHMALIGYGDKSKIRWWCGGSLISDRYILSAATCADGGGSQGKAKWVRLGEYNKNTTKDDEDGDAQPRNYEIIETIIHHNYSPAYNNIALFKLNDSVKFNKFVRPICLNTERHQPGASAIATGWGIKPNDGRLSLILKTINLSITTTANCSEFFPAGKKLKSGIDDETMICAGNFNDDWDTCRGDSGGPLQMPLNDPYCMYAQIGINSFGRVCGFNIPNVFTRVSPYVEWIEGIVWP